MSFLFALSVIIILSLSISYIFQKRFEYILPMTTAAISLILYVFSFFGARSIGIYFILTTLTISVAYLIYKIVHEHERISDVFKSAGFISFLLIAIFICIIIRGFVFSTWDEFSHWGLVLKNLYSSNDFGNLSNSTTLFKWYPQGISLFLNFTTHFSNHFSESSALGGMLALSYAQLMIMFTKIRYSDWKKILIITGIIVTAPLVFFSGFYNTIYVDVVMALIFANILCFSYSYPKKDVFYAIYMVLQFYLLVNTKQIGILLALIAFATIVTSYIYSADKIKPLKSFIANKKNELIYVFIPIVSVILTYLSWVLYIKRNNITENFSINMFGNFLNLFQPGSPNYHILTTINFINNFFKINQYGIINLSFFLWSILMILILYCVFRLSAVRKQKNFIFQLLIFIGLYLYSGMILITYLVGFDEYESTTLASVDRYLGSYFLGLFIVTIFMLIRYIINLRNNRLSSTIKISFILFILLSIMPINNLVDNTLLQQTSTTARHQIREPYEDMLKYKNLLDPKKDRVYIISQNTTGLDYYVLIYNFTPVRTQPWARTWSLGKPYSADDQWTANISVGEWAKRLKGYSYVYLFNVDDRFINDYGQLFENINDIKNKNLYSVRKIGDSVTLKIVSLK